MKMGHIIVKQAQEAKAAALQLALLAAAQKDRALKEKVLSDWYATNGSTVDPSIVKQEAVKAIYTLEDAKKMGVGKTLKTTAEFFARIGRLQVEKLPVFDVNVTDEILKIITK